MNESRFVYIHGLLNDFVMNNNHSNSRINTVSIIKSPQASMRLCNDFELVKCIDGKRNT